MITEKQKEYNRRYREKYRDKLNERGRIWRENNKEKLAEYRERNKGKLAEQKRIYYEEHKEKALAYGKVYREEHKDELRIVKRDWNRKNILTVSNKHIRVLKRDYPNDGACELCDRVIRRLGYHHWDDEVPKFGLWLCETCHNAAEVFERGLIDRYVQLKDKVSREVCIRDMPDSVKELLEAGIGRITN